MDMATRVTMFYCGLNGCVFCIKKKQLDSLGQWLAGITLGSFSLNNEGTGLTNSKRLWANRRNSALTDADGVVSAEIPCKRCSG